MSEKLVPMLTFANGVKMPQIGLGTWPMDDREAAAAVEQALKMGYRLIDTAQNYHNETGVGEGIRRSGLPRGDIFVTTKFNRQWHSLTGPRQACEDSLKRLGLDYVDLLLIHWPNPDFGHYVEAFEGMSRVLEAGLCRSIGVSNFKPTHLQHLFDAGFTPHLNQIQLDPYHQRHDIAALDQSKSIITQCWSPLERGGALLRDPVIVAIAADHKRSAGQIVLRWHVEKGYCPVPKSAHAFRQKDNLSIFDFKLSTQDVAKIDTLNRSNDVIIDSDSFGH